MSYKTILVNLNATERVDALLKLSTEIARQHQAHLIGLFVVPAVNIVPMTFYMEIPSEIFELNERKYEEIIAGVKSKFDAATRGDTFSSEWRTTKATTADIAEQVVANAQMADLVIVSQGDTHGSPDGAAELPERLIMEAGRPVLIIPKTGTFNTMGDHVLVAWNETQQATRAVFDSLPFLERASAVNLYWVDPQKDLEDKNAIAGAQMASTLARHNVKVEAGAAHSDGSTVGNTLIDRARRHGSDLLVMGGYGHSRFQEHIFGGVTKEILDEMHIPVLMSH